MSTESELALAPVTPGFHKATSTLATTLGIEPRMMVETLKKQCFPNQRADDISDAQLAAFISVANSLKFNPLVPGMLYAYPSKNGGIVPVTGPDGVFKVLDEQISDGKLDGYECIVFPEDTTQKPTHAKATIWRKNNERPSQFTAIFSEWIVSSNPNWAARPRHMIWLRAIKQCARQVIHGIPYDEDEVTIGDLKNVTPGTPVQRADPPARASKGAKAAKENAGKEVVVEQEPATPPAQTPAAAEPPKEATTPATQTLNAEPSTPAVPAPASQVTPRAFLKADEELTTICTVVKIAKTKDGAGSPEGVLLAVPGGTSPSVRVQLEGGYVGPATHLGGGIKRGDEVDVPEVWNGLVKVTLLGVKVANGTIRVRVQSVEPAEPAETAGARVVEE